MKTATSTILPSSRRARPMAPKKTKTGADGAIPPPPPSVQLAVQKDPRISQMPEEKVTPWADLGRTVELLSMRGQSTRTVEYLMNTGTRVAARSQTEEDSRSGSVTMPVEDTGVLPVVASVCGTSIGLEDDTTAIELQRNPTTVLMQPSATNQEHTRTPSQERTSVSICERSFALRNEYTTESEDMSTTLPDHAPSIADSRCTSTQHDCPASGAARECASSTERTSVTAVNNGLSQLAEPSVMSLNHALPTQISDEPSISIPDGNNAGDFFEDTFGDSDEPSLGDLGGAAADEDDEDIRPPPDDEEEGSTAFTAGGGGRGSVDTAGAHSGTDQLSKSKPKSRATIPSWLLTRYNNLCTQLRTEARSNNSHRPSCYDAGQFWIEPRAPIFAMGKQLQLYPSLFYEPRFFIWIPHHFGKIPCPACKALHIQYLEMVLINKRSVFGSLLMPHDHFGEWNSINGYGGYVPSGRYFRSIYDSLVEKYASEMDQYTAMLSAEILCVDLSYKVPKHLGKVNNEAVFGALATAVNEYGECRAMTLTSTKAHNQWMPALAAIPHSLRKYGHKDVALVFTDNVRADKTELERVFPSLLHDVQAVPSSTLPHLELVESWKVYKLDSTYQINTRLNSIMEDLNGLPSCEDSIHIAMDMEWSVDRENGIQGRVALISMAYMEVIYLVPVSSYLKEGVLHLPHTMLVLLRSSRIRKVGVHIKADLTRLFKDCGFIQQHDLPFQGAVELGAMAKERNITDRANISLADLTASVLHCYLPKDESIRVSTVWSDLVLPDEHARYASMDVYAAWLIYEAFSRVSVGQAISDSTPAGTRVQLLSRDRSSVVAYGFIAPDRPPRFREVNVSKTHVVVNITSVLQSGYLVRADLLKTKEETALESISSSCPFGLLCSVRDLRTHTGDPPPLANHTAPLPPLPYTSPQPPYPISGDLITSEMQSEDIDDLQAWHNHLNFDPDAEQSLVECIPNNAEAIVEASAVPETLTYEDTVIRSRILGDIWHLMNQFKISQHHGMSRPFARALRDALLIPDPDDKAALEEVLRTHGLSWDHVLLWRSDWVWKRVKRFVPRPDILHHRPLFNDASWEKAANVLENIQMGYYSDPPGIKLYAVQGTDHDGLTLYRCIRGTNNVEGGVHQNIAKRFGSYNASPRFAMNLLRDYVLCHNLKVGTLNRTGQPYQGSYDIWTRNRLSRLVDQIDNLNAFKATSIGHSMTGWVNGNDYERSAESIGILPLSDSARAQLGMLPFSADFVLKQKPQHAHLAKQQQTLIAVLPLHTREERALYRMLIKTRSAHFMGRTQPNWVALANEWSQQSDGIHIFYKLPEHLKNYHKAWSENRNEENSVEQHKQAYEQLRMLLVPESDRIPSIPVRAGTALAAEVDAAARVDHEGPPSDWHVDLLLGRHRLKQSAVHFEYSQIQAGPSNPIPSQPEKKREAIAMDAFCVVSAQMLRIRVRHSWIFEQHGPFNFQWTMDTKRHHTCRRPAPAAVPPRQFHEASSAVQHVFILVVSAPQARRYYITTNW
ncbi:hypothetical protein A0H81_03601 [Grifola frondosa]|uniref:3'-5' exonuclease n=1 Tax=Grifola frondosa TaxID=5627 RepID=A0A1C7MI50_GRIFR|nr:hypothetical protein A0H81_03601 [Grifola frondosa]